MIETLGAKAPQIILYNIPQNTGVPISPALSARLNAAFLNVVTAYKDRSGNWENTAAVIKAAPGISVFPASETLLSKAMALGAGGCISASCNSNVTAIRRLYEVLRDGDQNETERMQPGLEAHRNAVQDAGLISGLKSLKAYQSGDRRWLNLRPPHETADPVAGRSLAKTISQ